MTGIIFGKSASVSHIFRPTETERTAAGVTTSLITGMNTLVAGTAAYYEKHTAHQPVQTSLLDAAGVGLAFSFALVGTCYALSRLVKLGIHGIKSLATL